ncbi:MAG: TlpA family protein disulfide reductase [Lacipirellulaceae bacterium]
MFCTPSVPARALAATLALGLIANLASAQDNPDPLALLVEAADAVVDSAALSVVVSTRTEATMGEQQTDQTAGYRYTRRGADQFAFEAIDEQGETLDEGVTVRGDRGIVFTHIVDMKRYTLEESDQGIAPFIRSPLTRGIGAGLGALGLSFLHPAAATELKGEVENPEYVAVEDLDGVRAHHCRYLVEGKLPIEVWYAAEGKPYVLRVLPDLTEMMKGTPAAKKFDNFAYQVTFNFAGWEADAELGDEDFRIDRPDGPRMVESFFKAATPEPNPLLGVEAPLFELEDLEGEPVNLADHLGKSVILLDFWATWCPPCVEALPTIDRVASSFADKGVVFFAVNAQESAEDVKAFLEENELTPPVALDVDGTAAGKYGVEGLPTSVIIGKDGRVQVVHVGLSRALEQKLTEELTSLVAGEDLAGAIVAKHQSEVQRVEDLGAKLWARLAE